MSKHTPGPWWNSSSNEILGDPMGYIKIGRVFPISEKDDGSANARLVAAAPELLEALIVARKFILKTGVTYDNAEIYNKINNAIKIAT